MHSNTILIIDDEPQIRRSIRNLISREGARLLEAGTGAEGLNLAASSRPDLIILDLGLPDMTGVEVCRDLRGWTAAPILVLSARHSESEKVELLDAGADDYVTKPFSAEELSARVRALLRRAATSGSRAANARLACGDLVIDFAARSVMRAGQRVHLTPIEWQLLRVLAANAGRTLTHPKLFAEVWRGRSAGDAQQYLRVHVAHLRRKIEDDPVRPRYLITEPGVGYRFVDPTSQR